MEADPERAASAPHDFSVDPGANSSMRKAILLTTPRRQPRKASRTTLQPLGNEVRRPRDAGLSATTSGGFARGNEPAPPSMEKGDSAAAPKTPPQYSRVMKPSSSDGALNNKSRMRAVGSNALAPIASPTAASGSGSDSEDEKEARKVVIGLRKRMHFQACELQEVKGQLEQTTRELQRVQAEADELRLKHSNLERLDRRKSSELLDERRKNEELSKQVKEMSANLLNLCSMDGGGAQHEGSGLRKRCFKLVQQNTALSVQSRLLRRQKGWAEAKARVLQNEVTRVYLGIHDRVKDERELEQITVEEFASRQFPSDEAQVYQCLLPIQTGYQETIVDFLTHITHTSGNDIHGFLQSSRVFSEQIRNDCLTGLSREFYAVWRRYNQLPHILRAVERIVHLSDYLTAFESFSNEITSMLHCGHAKIWVVDRFRQCMWSCVRDGDAARTFTLPLPRGKNPDLSGKGIVSAAYLTQKPVNVIDAREDPRFRQEEEAGDDGHAKSVVCVPVCRHSKAGRQPQVRVVLQAVNKLTEPQFDPDVDVRVLRLLGKVSMEVLQVCEASSAASMNTKRKEALLQLLIDCTPCEGPATLLNALDRGLAETFLSQGSALHVIVGQGVMAGRPQGGSTAKLTLDHSQRKIVYVPTEGLKGIIGEVAGSWNQISMAASQMESSRYDSAVDLSVSEKSVLHTVPVFDSASSTCIAVIQFNCPEKERTMLSDDGAYHPDNPSHFQLLKRILTFVQKHLDPIQKQDELVKQGEAVEKDIGDTVDKDKSKKIDEDDDDDEDFESDSGDVELATRQSLKEAVMDDLAKKNKKEQKGAPLTHLRGNSVKHS